MSDPLSTLLSRRDVVLLDGGLATELERRGADLDDPLWSARLLIEAPDAIGRVHLDYLRAGADCIVSASYQATFEGFARRGLDDQRTGELLRLSVDLAREARDRFWAEAPGSGRERPLVGASVGPYGAYLADGSEYRGDYGLEVTQLEAFHRPRLEVLEAAGADVLALETIPSLPEALALCQLLTRPAWLSFSCRDGRSLWDGTPLRRAVEAVAANPWIVAVGVNCTAPEHVVELLAEAAAATDKPLVAYPNSGERYDAVRKRWLPGAAPLDWGRAARAWRAAGARVLGGCCRSRPADVAAMRQAVSPGPSSGGR